MQRARRDRGGIAAADELGEKVVRVLAVSDVGERADCRSMKTPACTSTCTRKRACRSVKPNAVTALTRSGRMLSHSSRGSRDS